jgi:uncharacterized protein (UPF0332 family)
VDAAAFLEFARQLAANENLSAAGHRTVTSRAYYGAFHAARHALERVGVKCPRGDNEHQFVQRALLNCQVPLAVEAGRLLENLHQGRKEADYDLDALHTENRTTADLSLLRADDIVTKLAACSSGVLSQQFAAGVSQYLRAVKKVF